MFERKNKLRIDDFLYTEFDFVEDKEYFSLNLLHPLIVHSQTRKIDNKRRNRSANEHHQIMTRKTRTRRPRVHSIQSGYCAVCHIPYNNVEEHIQSKRHQKLIGEDANYISLNGYNDVHEASIDSFLNLNGIDAIGVNGTTIDRDFSLRVRTKNMSRSTRAASVCDRVKPSPLSPTGSDTAGHRLRSRRNINYMTPPLDDDSLSEKPDIEPAVEYHDRSGLRSSTRLLAAKLNENDDVWTSGRPKRTCIRQKRISADERLVADNKSYYKVEVLPTKLRSSGISVKEESQKYHVPSSKFDKDDDKKCKKKMRNSELVQLNNEATNFLFPKKDDDDDSSTEGEDDGNATISSVDEKNDSCSMTSEDSRMKFKMEDDASMDSSCSTKKKRRTHAEAFIMDNQKYYKFETPGSRLRYHGSYLSPQVEQQKLHRHNGDSSTSTSAAPVTTADKEKKQSPKALECKKKKREFNFKVCFDNYNFSFEQVPKGEAWYNTFQRQDRGDISYTTITEDSFLDPFVMPYQLGPLPPLDPKICISKYNQIIKLLREPPSASTSVGCSTPDPCTSNSSYSIEAPDTNDEDSKISLLSTVSSTSTFDDPPPVEKQNKKRGRRPKALQIQPTTPSTGKNPRKSPRQHASTLAILSSLIQQRKRRYGSRQHLLPTIPEESHRTKQPKKHSTEDMDSKLKALDEQLSVFDDEKFDDLHYCPADAIDFRNSKVAISEIISLYNEEAKKETVRSTRRFFNGTPGRKPGRRKKKNKTGWPSKNRRLIVRKDHSNNIRGDDDESILDDSTSVHLPSEDEEDEEVNSTDSISNKIGKNNNLPSSSDNHQNHQTNDLLSDDNNSSVNCDSKNNRVDRNEHNNDNNKVLTNKVTNDCELVVQFQPYVCVEKLDNSGTTSIGVTKIAPTTTKRIYNRKCLSPKRSQRKQRRRMPASPKSPRMLRKPRGRWYRER